MCSGDDHNCPEFRQHRQKLLEDLDSERRTFLKNAFVTGGGAAAWVTGNTLMSPASAQVRPGRPTPPTSAQHSAVLTGVKDEPSVALTRHP